MSLYDYLAKRASKVKERIAVLESRIKRHVDVEASKLELEDCKARLKSLEDQIKPIEDNFEEYNPAQDEIAKVFKRCKR